MTNRYLLAAEADKIQDFIFRAAHLREVVGGSQLLVRFCEEAPGLFGVPEADIVVNAGGSFRILFDSKQAALDFGDKLAELYRRAADGALTVAEPVEMTSAAYGPAGVKAEEKLRYAKRRRQGAESSPQLPIIAFCANCGTGLAAAYAKRHSKENNAQHLCAACLDKAIEREEERKAGKFLERFYHLVAHELGKGVVDESDKSAGDDLYWPGHKFRQDTKDYDPVEDVADYDSRRYVAYLVADGNSMGEIFGMCQTKEQITRLSKGLDDVVQTALAEPTQWMMRWAESGAQHRLIPVLPLILGGDDVFALLPAPWALDFAAHFCRHYELGMKELLAEDIFQSVRDEYSRTRAKLSGSNESATRDEAVLQPTMAATVVICKASHPYALAHAAGHERLQAAKQAIKQLAYQRQREKLSPLPRSAINFAVILGGQLAPETGEAAVRPTLRPYWSDEVPAGWGLPLQRLLDQRVDLAHIPNKRLIQLRALFDHLPERNDPASLQAWAQPLVYLLGRLERQGQQSDLIKAALAQLGDEVDWKAKTAAADIWCDVKRGSAGSWCGHGLPDLIETWDWTLRLDKDRASYKVEV